MTKQTSAAAAVTVIGIAVAIVVNVLTSGWSWTIFALLAVLSGIWIVLAVWQGAAFFRFGTSAAALASIVLITGVLALTAVMVPERERAPSVGAGGS